MMALARRLAPSLLVVANQGFNSLANFAITLWLIRALGLEAFGSFTVYWLVSLLVVGLVNALVSLPMVSMAGQLAPERRRQLLTSAIALVTAAILMLLAMAAGAFLAGGPMGTAKEIAIVAVLASCQLAAEFSRRLLFFVGRNATVWALDVARYALVVVLFWFTYQQAQVSPAAFALDLAAAGGLAATSVAVLMSTEIITRLNFTEFWPNAARLLRSGAWLALSNLVHFANDNLFLVVASSVVGPAATGVLRACQTIVGLVNPLLQSLEYMLPRRLGEDMARLGSAEAIRIYLKRSCLLLLGFGALLFVVAALADPLLAQVVGEAGDDIGWLLRMYCLLTWLIAAVALINILLRATNRTVSIFLGPLVAATLSVVTVVPLSEWFGVWGVASGVLAAEVVIALIQLQAVWLVLAEARIPAFLQAESHR